MTGSKPLPLDNSVSHVAEMMRLLTFLGKHGASDLHLKVGDPPYARIGGHLRQMQMPSINDTSEVTNMIRPALPHAGRYRKRFGWLYLWEVEDSGLEPLTSCMPCYPDKRRIFALPSRISSILSRNRMLASHCTRLQNEAVNYRIRATTVAQKP